MIALFWVEVLSKISAKCLKTWWENELTRFGFRWKALTIIVFSRSGYKDLLGTPKRLLLRPSGNIMIVSRKTMRGFCGDAYETLVSLIEMYKVLKGFDALEILGKCKRGYCEDAYETLVKLT